MRNRFHYALLVAIIMLCVLPACERSASTASGEVPTEIKVKVNPTPTNNQAQMLIASTQTAIAAKRPTKAPPVTPTKKGEGETTETAPSIIETITPTPEATLEPTEIRIPTLTRPVSYTLKAYEDPFCIARRYNLDIGELLSQNSLTTDSKPPVGTVLIIPATNHRWNSGARTLMYHPGHYNVRSKDTIEQIACMYGDVSPEAIIIINQLQEPVTLTAGQELIIP
jgi:hypothetical protein